MFFILSKLLDLFLSPYSWGLALFAYAVPWHRGAASRWQRRRNAGIVGFVILGAASSRPVANAMAWSLEHATESTYRDDVTYDAVVLLGGVVDEEVTAQSGQVSYNDNVERLVRTHALLRDDKARFVILSGAAINPDLTRFGDAVVLGRQLEEWGIDRGRILIEDRARNTRENAVYTQEMARARGLERVVVVTSAFHMARAVECFNAVGMPVDTLAVDYRAHEHVRALGEWLPRAQPLGVTTAVFREVLGRFVYRAQGYGKRAR